MTVRATVLILSVLPGVCAAAQAARQSSACHADMTAASDADAAAYKEDWKTADGLYRAELEKNPGDDEVRGQLVRTLLGEGKLADAEVMAKEMLAAKPTSAEAELAMGRVFYREGDVPNAYKHVHQSVTLDPCNGRAHYMLGKIYALTLMEASATREYATAHALKPTDNSIQIAWMYWLPKAKRAEALTEYINHSPYYDSKDVNLQVALDDAKSPDATAEKCLAVNAPPETKIALEPIFTDPFVRGRARYGTNVERLDAGDFEDPNFPVKGWGLDVMLNGKRRRLEVSTEVKEIVLARSAAAALDLKVEEHVHLQGTASFLTKVDDLKIGNLEFHNCQTVVYENRDLPNGRDGLIGLNVLRDYLITLDPPAREMTLTPLPPAPGDESGKQMSLQTIEDDQADAKRRDRYVPPGMAGWTRMYNTWSLWLMPTRLETGRERLFIFNTSSTFSLFDTEFAKGLTRVDPMQNVFSYDSHGVKQRVLKADKITLYYAGIKQPMLDVYVENFQGESADYGMEIDGVLGMQSFPGRALQLDYRDGLFQVAPNGKP